MKPKKEPLIIDMRNANTHDLFVLARLLVTVNHLLSAHGFSVQIKKTKAQAQPSPLKTTLS